MAHKLLHPCNFNGLFMEKIDVVVLLHWAHFWSCMQSFFPQSWTCFPGMYMLMSLFQRWYHHNLQSTDGLTILANWLGIVTILVHYLPSYNTSHTMKPSDPLLLTDVAAGCILQAKLTSLDMVPPE
jgi:hypothetical protein